MKPTDWIALAAVIVSPAAALAGVWASAYLSSRARRAEQEDRARTEALSALGGMRVLLADASPDLIVKNELREYETPEDAIRGLYARWLTSREPLVLLSVTHPSPEVRHLAFQLQAQAELSLRMTENMIKGQKDDPMSPFAEAFATADRLGKLLSPFAQ